MNSLNQYTSIVTPGIKDIIGAALATNSVTVNSGVADRHGEYFHRQISVANTNQPVWQNVTNISGSFTNRGGLVFPANSQTLVYDADGNLSSDSIWTYQWDAENRLISMTMTNNVAGIAASNRLKLDFAYDFMGRRVQKIVSVWNSSTLNYQPSTTNRFIYDGWNLLAIINPQSSILQSFMWGNDLSGAAGEAGGVGGLLMASISGTNCFVTYDGNGNITSLINATDKSLAALYEYSPYGELLRETGLLARQNPFRFSTKFWDDESGLVYYGYRFYYSSFGRWLSRDPNEQKGSLNLCAFVENSPGDGFDALGLFTSWNHHKIIDLVFPDLSKYARSELKAGSDIMDKEFSAVEFSYMHAMTPKTWVKKYGEEEAKRMAEKAAQDFVDEQFETAIEEGSRFELGKGMHTIMDSFSPQHSGFKVWRGFSGLGILGSTEHGLAEMFLLSVKNVNNLTGENMDSCESMLRGYYDEYELLSQ